MAAGRLAPLEAASIFGGSGKAQLAGWALLPELGKLRLAGRCGTRDLNAWPRLDSDSMLKDLLTLPRFGLSLGQFHGRRNQRGYVMHLRFDAKNLARHRQQDDDAQDVRRNRNGAGAPRARLVRFGVPGEQKAHILCVLRRFYGFHADTRD